MNILAMERWSLPTFFGYHGALLTIISLSFVVIRFHSEMGTFLTTFLFGVNLEVAAATSYCIYIAVNQAKHSAGWYLSFLRNDFGRSAYDYRFWKTCRPIEISVGGFYTMSSQDFEIQVFGPVISESVANLLLAF
jgi:hypothetical protein